MDIEALEIVMYLRYGELGEGMNFNRIKENVDEMFHDHDHYEAFCSMVLGDEIYGPWFTEESLTKGLKEIYNTPKEVRQDKKTDVADLSSGTVNSLEALEKLLSKNKGSFVIDNPSDAFLDYDYSDGTDGERVGVEYDLCAREIYLKGSRVWAKCDVFYAESDSQEPLFTEEYFVGRENFENIKDEINHSLLQPANIEMFPFDELNDMAKLSLARNRDASGPFLDKLFWYEHFDIMERTLSKKEYEKALLVIREIANNPVAETYNYGDETLRSWIMRTVERLTQKEIPMIVWGYYHILCVERAEKPGLSFDEIRMLSHHDSAAVRNVLANNEYIPLDVWILAKQSDAEIQQSYIETPSNYIITTREGADAYDAWKRHISRLGFQKVDDIPVKGMPFDVAFESWTDNKGHNVFITKSFYGNMEFLKLGSNEAKYDLISGCVDVVTSGLEGNTYCLIHGSDIALDNNKWIESGILPKYSEGNRITAVFHHFGPQGHHGDVSVGDPYFIPGRKTGFYSLQLTMDAHSLMGDEVWAKDCMIVDYKKVPVTESEMLKQKEASSTKMISAEQELKAWPSVKEVFPAKELGGAIGVKEDGSYLVIQDRKEGDSLIYTSVFECEAEDDRKYLDIAKEKTLVRDGDIVSFPCKSFPRDKEEVYVTCIKECIIEDKGQDEEQQESIGYRNRI